MNQYIIRYRFLYLAFVILFVNTVFADELFAPSHTLSIRSDVSHQTLLNQYQLVDVAILDRNPDMEASIIRQAASITAKASCQIKPLFSSEKESWPFETFVLNGLFPVVAKYQKNHPQAVFIEDGVITLTKLYRCINDESILQKSNGFYVLKYPLIIDDQALLDISNDELVMLANTGASIINTGVLLGRNTKISSSSSSENKTLRFNGFITTWARASLLLENAKINDLGFDGHLSGGLSFAKSVHQQSADRLARAFIKSVSFNNVFEPIWSDKGNVRVQSSIFSDSISSVFTIKNSKFSILSSQILNVTEGDGIRLSENMNGLIKAISITHVKGSGIKIDDVTGGVDIVDNDISLNETNGVSIKSSLKSSRQGKVVLSENRIRQNLYSGVSLQDTANLIILDNVIEENRSYGITASSDNEMKKTVSLILSGNRIAFNTAAPMRLDNLKNILIGPNKFRGLAIDQRIFNGDLRFIQSAVLKPGLLENQFIEYIAQ